MHIDLWAQCAMKNLLYPFHICGFQLGKRNDFSNDALQGHLHLFGLVFAITVGHFGLGVAEYLLDHLFRDTFFKARVGPWGWGGVRMRLGVAENLLSGCAQLPQFLEISGYKCFLFVATPPFYLAFPADCNCFVFAFL